MADFRWTIVAGSYLSLHVVNNISYVTIPVTDDDVRPEATESGTGGGAPIDFAYVAKWGNDITGNGSRLKPWATIQGAYDGLVNAGPGTTAARFVIIVGSGTYNQTLIQGAYSYHIFGDGDVVFDGANLPVIPGPIPEVPDYFTYLGSDNNSLINLTIKNYIHVGKVATPSSPNSGNNFIDCVVRDCEKVNNAQVSNLGTNNFQHYRWGSTNTIFYNITKSFSMGVGYNGLSADYDKLFIKKTSFINCKCVAFKIDTNSLVIGPRDCLFKNSNIWVYEDGNNTRNTFDYFSFHNCNFRFNTSGGSPSPTILDPTLDAVTFPNFGASGSVPVDFQYIATASVVKSEFDSAFGPKTVSDPQYMDSIIDQDPLLNDIEMGDFSLGNSSPAKVGAAGSTITKFQYHPNGPIGTWGSEFGARGVGQKIKSGVDFVSTSNMTLVENGTLDYYQLASDTSSGEIRTNVFDLGSFKELEVLEFFGDMGYFTGQYMTDLDDLGPVQIIGPLLDTQYVLGTGATQAYVVSYDSPEPITFYDVGGTVSVFPGEKFTAYDGANTASSEFGTAEVQPIIETNSYNLVEMRTSNIVFTDATSEGTVPYFRYHINQQPTCNRTGNNPTGTITAGNADSNFDAANAYPVRAKYVQLRVTIQNNNLY
jgi:hypothetical protein